ncbi:MAG TPA: L-dopachrome tautomerase-related protein [Agromyces sp.]
MIARIASLIVLLTAAPALGEPRLEKIASFKHQVTGVAVSPDGRIFVNFPRWSEDAPVSVAEVKKNGELVPFPDPEWNAWRNAKKDQISAKDHRVCVQSVVADAHGNLWVLDPAAPAQDKVVKGGPKLVQIDLETNKPAKLIAFDETVAPQGSYLTDVRFSPDGKTAYITDSGARGAIVVVDLASGKARRILDGDPSTQPDPTVTVTSDGKPLRKPDGRGVEFAADGIALSPDGKTLYWQAIKGKTLYSIPTANIDSAKPQVVGENGPADGLWIGRDGRMYITSIEDSSLKVRDLAAANSKPNVYIADKRLRWPDSFAEAADGTLYVTTSHIQDSAGFKPGAPISLPTELWAVKPGAPKAASR